MKRFFASYAREDQHLVEPVVKILRATSTRVFFDVDSIEPAQKWREELEKALSESMGLFVFWSFHSSKSAYVDDEWRAAQQAGKDLFPVLLDSTPLPDGLAEYQWIDFRDLVSQYSGAQKLKAPILRTTNEEEPSLSSDNSPAVQLFEQMAARLGGAARIRRRRVVLFAKDIPPGSKEFSLLAIVETLCACSLAMWLALRHGWMTSLAVYICIAPLLLLRTRYSQRIALNWLEALADKVVKNIVRPPPDEKNEILGLIYLLLFPLSAIPVKIAATIRSLLKNTRIAIVSIPRNWVLQVVQTDTTLPPEIVPGISKFVGRIPRNLALTFSCPHRWLDEVCDLWRNHEDYSHAALITLFLLPTLLLATIFGLAYRWALKATAVVWLPLVLLVGGVYRTGDTLTWRVRGLMTTPLSRLLRVYGAIVIVFNGILPLVLFAAYFRGTTWIVQTFQVPPTIAAYFFVTHTEVPSWQIAGVVAALCTWIAYIWAGSIKVELKERRISTPDERRRKLRGLQSLLTVRAFCSSYTIVCGVIAFAKAADFSWVKGITIRWLP